MNIENVELELIGIETGSSLNNCVGIFSSILILIILNILVWLLPDITLDEKSNKWTKVIKNLVTKLSNLFMFTIYIRTIMESYQFLLLANISNLRDYDVSTAPQIASLSFSAVIFALCVLFLVAAFMMFQKSNKKSKRKKRLKWEEFLSGVKEKKIAKIYCFLALLRRFLMVSWLLLSKPLGAKGSVEGLLLVQIPYFIFFIIVRPFDQVKNNMVEGTNELFLVVIISYLCFYNTESMWTDSATQIFIYVILGNTAVVVLILFGKYFV